MNSRHTVLLAAAAAVVVAAVVGGVHELKDNFRYSVGAPQRDRETVVDVTLDRRPGTATRIDATALWTSCSSALTAEQLRTPVRHLEPGRFEVVVHPALSGAQRTRLRGCLNDLTVHRVLAHRIALHERDFVAPPLRPDGALI